MGTTLPGTAYRESARVQRNQKYHTYTVSEERVRKAVRELRNGKSCGPEGIYAEMLKHATESSS
jgi:hypothetical protein